jgi:hypothetical protein
MEKEVGGKFLQNLKNISLCGEDTNCNPISVKGLTADISMFPLRYLHNNHQGEQEIHF